MKTIQAAVVMVPSELSCITLFDLVYNSEKEPVQRTTTPIIILKEKNQQSERERESRERERMMVIIIIRLVNTEIPKTERRALGGVRMGVDLTRI